MYEENEINLNSKMGNDLENMFCMLNMINDVSKNICVTIIIDCKRHMELLNQIYYYSLCNYGIPSPDYVSIVTKKMIAGNYEYYRLFYNNIEIVGEHYAK